jgi:hypothetical protein
MHIDHHVLICYIRIQTGINAEGLIAMAATGSRIKKGALRSRCAVMSHEHELRRIQGMTMEERVVAALTMKQRFVWVQPARIR